MTHSSSGVDMTVGFFYNSVGTSYLLQTVEGDSKEELCVSR